MGGGSWSGATYTATSMLRSAAGIDDFAYDHDIHTGKVAAKVHATLDPKGVAFRECRDSAEHPNSLPIAIALDVTGSMSMIPRRAVKDLPELFGTLMRDGRIADPQILFGAISDGTCDQSCIQVGQFESDNRSDQQLMDLWLESGGGGQQTESYEIFAYFMARHTSLDSVEKRGHKGYLFIIGDEMPYPRVSRGIVKTFIGDDLGESLTTEAIFAELKEKFNVFYILPKGTSYYGDTTTLNRWKGLLGQNVIQLEKFEDLCATIALQVALGEDAIDYDDALDEARSLGVSTALIKPVDAGGSRNVVTAPTLPGLNTVVGTKRF